MRVKDIGNFSKKCVSIILAAAMTISMAACGSSGSSGSSGDAAQTGDQKAQEAAPAESTDAAAENADETQAADAGEEAFATPYSNGPMSTEDIVADLVSKYNLEELPAEDKDYTITMGYYNCDHMAAASVGEATGIFDALGLKVDVIGNANVPEAMSAGQMDIAYAGWTTTLNAVKNDVPLFYACENHTGGSEYLVVNNDIKDASELVGKSISIGTDPETTNTNWVEWTKDLNIPVDSTKYEAFSMSDADEYLAMASGDLDAYIACDPWGSMAEYSGVGHIIYRQNTDRPSGHGTCCKVAMNYNFAKAHPALASRILLAHTVCLQYMYEHPYKAAEIFSAYYNVPVEVAIMTFWRKFVDEGRTIRWDLNKEYMYNQLATMRELGVRDDINNMNLDDYIDLSYFENSGAMDFEQFIKENIDPVFPEGMDYESFKATALKIEGVKAEDVPEYVERDF